MKLDQGFHHGCVKVVGTRMKVSEAYEVPELFHENQKRMLGELVFKPEHEHLELLGKRGRGREEGEYV